MCLTREKRRISCAAGRAAGADTGRHRGATEAVSEGAAVASETAVLRLHSRPWPCPGGREGELLYHFFIQKVQLARGGFISICFGLLK